jgi:LAS superfamily LD-carboxypeptidase LdcB
MSGLRALSVSRTPDIIWKANRFSMLMNEFELTGRSTSHVVAINELDCSLHVEAVTSLLAMRAAAKKNGIDLRVRSAFRDFDTQLLIWNRKWRGERPLLSRTGQPLDAAALTPDERLDAILIWSAIPGGSRHHWGTEFDLIDAAAVTPGYQVQLIPEAYASDGIFAKLYSWLEANARRFGFYRPYRTDQGGVSPEPWHFSYAPVSLRAMELLSLTMLRRVLEQSEIDGRPQILARLPEIYTRFLLAVDLPSN